MNEERAKKVLQEQIEKYGQEYDAEGIEALEMAIKALELIHDFETARIITGGRLNGRTYAYKCGLADGQRLAKGEKLFNILPLEAESEDTE